MPEGEVALKTHQPCEDCGSSDALAIYPTHTTCFSCEKQHWFDSGDREIEVDWEQKRSPVDREAGTFADISDRRISRKTCAKYGVKVEFGNDGKIDVHHYPYYNTKTGEHTATKRRFCATKDFPWSGTRTDTGLFGQQACRGKGKYITLVEGELDCLAVAEMFDNKWDVVSIKDGSGSAKRNVQDQLEFLEGYDNVVVCFDMDKAGKEAVDSIKDLFSPQKLRIVQLPEGFKDAGAMLQAGKVVEFTKSWWDAKVYRPDGIVAGDETWDLLVKNRQIQSVPYPWEGLNELTRGHRLGELVTITSGSGMGKSQFIREMEYDLLHRTESRIGVLALEEDLSRTALGIMSVAANRPLHLEEDTPVDDLRPFWEATMGTGRYYLLDHWGSTSADNLLSRVRYMVKALECDRIILDHLSIVVSSQESGDERKAIDEIMTKLRALCAETGCSLFLVSHLKRSGGTAHEDGGRISLSELRGSQSIAQLSDIVIGMERDQQHEDPRVRNTTCVRVLKNRYTGETGPACYLYYDKSTGRMTECDAPIPDNDMDGEF